MSREVEIDEEVLADLRLRDETEADKTRSRKLPSFEPAPTVRTLPCRNCGAPCELSTIGQERLDFFNALLLRRGEPAINENETLMCSECRVKWERMKADHNRTRAEQMEADVKRLRAAKDPDKCLQLNPELEARLSKRHPDFKGLLEAVRARANSGKKRASKPEEVSGG